MKFSSQIIAVTAVSIVALLTAIGTPMIAAAEEKKVVETAPVDAVKKNMTDGEVKKVDKDAGKVTIKHGEIKNLEMPPMTMVFRVKDAGMLDALKIGDKINFTADKLNGNYTVTAIELKK